MAIENYSRETWFSPESETPALNICFGEKFKPSLRSPNFMLKSLIIFAHRKDFVSGFVSPLAKLANNLQRRMEASLKMSSLYDVKMKEIDGNWLPQKGEGPRRGSCHDQLIIRDACQRLCKTVVPLAEPMVVQVKRFRV